MRILRNIFLSAMLAFSSVAVADDYAYLTIGQISGETSVEVSRISRITFDTENMILHLSDDTTRELPLASLTKMFFSSAGQGVSAFTTESKIQLDGGYLRLRLGDGERAVVYNMNGEAVFTAVTPTELDLGRLQRGVYIVRVGSEVKKVMSR